MIVQIHQGIRIGAAAPVAGPLLDALAAHLGRPAGQSSGVLGGRVRPDFVELPGWGSVVIKHFARGGWLRFVNRRAYLRTRCTRGRAEFEMLQRLRELGLPVPRPLAWAERGRLWVHAWLIMEELRGAATLADLARTDPDRARALLPRVSEILSRLIGHRIHHVDMHPGNVVVAPGDEVFLIDFDKAAGVDLAPAELAARYRRRWQRSVEKHRLPAWIHEELQLTA